MNKLKEQAINLLTNKMIDNAHEANDWDWVISHLLIFGRHYCLADQSTDVLVDMAWDEYNDEFLDSEEGKSNNDDVPERTRFENWLMKQDVPNWYGRG